VNRTSSPPHGILIADPDPVVRSAVRTSLADEPDLEVTDEASSASEAVELGSGEPELVAIAASLPDRSGIAATREIVTRSPGTKVVVLSSTDDEERAIEALRAGAAGFLPKTIDPAVLPHVLRRVLQGEVAISRRLEARVLTRVKGEYWSPHLRFRPIDSPLTPREWDVLELLHEGESTPEIARALELKLETARAYVRRIYRKLGARSRDDAVRKALHTPSPANGKSE
jgi:two-component system nitrate/nitrite response regulator NarL